MAKQIDWDAVPADERVYSRDGSTFGMHVGTKPCTMHDCRGHRIGTRWPDGKLTWPCARGMITRPDGSWQIG